ncbi:MAG: hypothetical protein HMLIMOIP_001590 [Candidatus Nitrosomirales archaeon]|jgi:hypothetical protein
MKLKYNAYASMLPAVYPAHDNTAARSLALFTLSGLYKVPKRSNSLQQFLHIQISVATICLSFSLFFTVPKSMKRILLDAQYTQTAFSFAAFAYVVCVVFKASSRFLLPERLYKEL